MKGAPWELIPGLGERELKSSVCIKMPEEPIQKLPNARQEVVPARRARITRQDIERVGHTPGCPGCSSTLRGGVRREHAEQCRKILEDALTAAGEQKVVRAQEQILERAAEAMSEQEENKAKRVKVEPDNTHNEQEMEV